MNTRWRVVAGVMGVCMLLVSAGAAALTTTFFNAAQVASPVSTDTTSETISSEGYLFTYTRDNLFTGGIGLTTPIGRQVRVPWPDGVEAQAVTVGPVGPAQVGIKRVDGAVFDLMAFSFELLANTGGAGASIEVMPKLNGEDALNDPVALDATGYYSSSFSYAPSLLGYDAYQFSLYVDFALTGLTLADASVAGPPPTVPLPAGLVLLPGALALLGVGGRRRKSVPTSAAAPLPGRITVG